MRKNSVCCKSYDENYSRTHRKNYTTKLSFKKVLGKSCVKLLCIVKSMMKTYLLIKVMRKNCTYNYIYKLLLKYRKMWKKFHEKEMARNPKWKVFVAVENRLLVRLRARAN